MKSTHPLLVARSPSLPFSARVAHIYFCWRGIEPWTLVPRRVKGQHHIVVDVAVSVAQSKYIHECYEPV